jgi:hypothetical protein
LFWGEGIGVAGFESVVRLLGEFGLIWVLGAIGVGVTVIDVLSVLFHEWMKF